MGFKPAECAVIEDSEVGIMAAKAGGFDVFGFTNEKNKAAFGKLGATTFSTMKELDNLLKFD
jgi:beta-phosphoglucomutase-like phosphatase (HAD superfamily)